MLNEELEVEYFSHISDFYDSIPIELKNGILATPFQYKTWQNYLYLEHKKQRRSGEYFGAILYKNGIPIVGGNFFYKTKGKRKGVFLLSNSSGESDYNDLIYFNLKIQEQDIKYFINHILYRKKAQKISIDRMPENSPFFTMAMNNNSQLSVKYTDCAHIDILDSYADYWASLSKSVRQNIRTAKNRLIKDNKKYTITYYISKKIPDDIANQLLNIYEERRIAKNNSKKKLRYILTEIIRRYRKNSYNVVLNSMKLSNNNFAATISIDDNVAGYFYGLNDGRGKASIIHVSFNMDYRKYSPGMILLSDAMQHVHEERLLSCFDLATGNEKYKFDLKAKIHRTVSFDYEID